MRKDTDLKIIDFSLIVNNPHRKRVAFFLLTFSPEDRYINVDEE